MLLQPPAGYSDLLFTPDATFDIGKTGATRARDLFLSRNLTLGGVFSAPGVPILLRGASGTDVSAGAANVDTVAISGLTALDTLLIEYGIRSVTQATAKPILRNNTDALDIIVGLVPTGAAMAAGDKLIGTVKLRQLQHSNVSVFTQSITSVPATGALQGDVFNPGFTTPWTGAWTLALRHGGVTAGGTFQWSWAVYKLPGQ